MKRIIAGAALVLLSVFLVACGGDSTTVVSNSVVTPIQEPLTIMFDNCVATISFGNNISAGLISPVDNVADVEFVRWQSTPDGWGDDSTVTGTIWSDGECFTATVSGIRPEVSGNFVVKLKSTGEVVWFDLGKWRYSKNATYDSVAGGVSYFP